MNGELVENYELPIKNTDSVQIDKKMIEENHLIWTGFHKKAFKERLNHVNY